MIGFGIDEAQAEYVAEIRLRHLNREYILKRTGEIEALKNEIADLNDILAKPARIRRIIIQELTAVAKKYGQPRRSEVLYDLPAEEADAGEEAVPDYPVTVFFTREGYLKKITPQSLRSAGAHKLKEGDEIVVQAEARNNLEALFFTDRHQVYKTRLAEFEDGKVGQMGVYLPTRLGMEEGENPIAMVLTSDYSGWMLFFFASGKCAKVPLASYATKQNRRKLLRAYSDKEPLAALLFLPEEQEVAVRTSAGRLLLVERRPAAAGGLGPDRRKGHPGQPGRGGGHPEKEPDHHLGPPGGRPRPGRPAPLPGAHPAGPRRAAARRRHRGADDAALSGKERCLVQKG